MREDIERIGKEIAEVESSMALLKKTEDPLIRAKFSRALRSELESLYTGIESLMEKGLKTVKEAIPSGEGYHKQMLVAASENELVPADAYEVLDELRGLRHFARHSYGKPIREEPVLDGGTRVPEAARLILDKMTKFVEKTEGNIAAALRGKEN